MEIAVAEKKRGMRNFFCDVPEGCIASIISITTPIDACRFAVVSRDFLLASKSDVVWDRFLPSDYELIVTRSDGGDALLTEFQNKKKHLYMRLADRHRPLLVDAASKCFWLERSSGKKCWRIAARSLSIAWSDHPYLWKWTSLPESRFPEVAELLYSQWIDIRGRINSSILSQDTQYAAYLIFNTVGETVGLHYACEASVSIVGSETTTRTVYFGDDYKEIRKSRWGMSHPRPETKPDQIPRPRTDGWLELKIGELFTYAVEEDDEVEFSVIQIEGMNGKKGLIVEGIESFWLDKSSGRKCFMIAARSLTIIWSDTPRYWKWTSNPESRFPEVAELLSVCWLEIRGKIKTSMLSPGTRYNAYLVLKVTNESFGLHILSEASVGTAGGTTETKSVRLSRENEHQFPILRMRAPRQFPAPPPMQFLAPHRHLHRLRLPCEYIQEPAKIDQFPEQRTDGWQELKIGEFFTRLGEEDEVEFSVQETKNGNWKTGLIVEGIEVRPA